MAWVNAAERDPPTDGEYRVKRMSRDTGKTYDGVCAFFPPVFGSRRRRGSWYSTTSGGRVGNVVKWYEVEHD